MHLPYKVDKVFSVCVCEMLGTIHDHYSRFINSLGITKCWCSNSNFYLFHLLAKIQSHFVIVNSLVTLSYNIYRNGRENSYFFNLKLFFLLCGIFFPWPGIKPMFPALKVWSLNHWTTSEVSFLLFFSLIYVLYCSIVDLQCFRCTARWFNYM